MTGDFRGGCPGGRRPDGRCPFSVAPRYNQMKLGQRERPGSSGNEAQGKDIEFVWIMIAGPYRTGARTEADREANLLAMNRAAYQVFRKGHVPIIGVNLALPVIQAAGPETYDAIMMPLSLALADRCDAILRIGNFSPGADDEVERVRARGGRVYLSVAEIPDASSAD